MRLFFVLLLLLVVLPSVGAASLQVVSPGVESYLVGSDGVLSFQVFSSASIPDVVAACVVDVYNRSGANILSEALSFSGEEFVYSFNDSVFGRVGSYSFVVYCNDGLEYGFVSGSFIVDNKTTTRLFDDPVVPVDKGGASIAVTIFILFITLLLFSAPNIINRFSVNVYADLILKRAFYVIGVYLMILNSAILATIASDVGLPVVQELLRYMWLFGVFGYVGIFVLFIKTFWDVIEIWKHNVKDKRGLL